MVIDIKDIGDAPDVMRHELEWVLDGVESALKINHPNNVYNGSYMSNPTVMGAVDVMGELIRDAPQNGMSKSDVQDYDDKLNKILQDYNEQW